MKEKNVISKLIFNMIIFLCIICLYGKVNATENTEKSTETKTETNTQTTTSTETTTNTETTTSTETSSTVTTEQSTSSSESQATEASSQERESTENSQTSPAEKTGATTTATNKNQKNTQTSQSSTKNTKKSSNANLKMLGITPNDFSGFKPATTTYKATVPNNVEQVNVYATAQDSKAKVSGTGNQKLDIGENALSVIVEAEDGTKKTYTINITREDSDGNETNTTTSNTTENKEELKNDIVKLEIAGYTLTPEFSPNIYEYKLDVNKDVTELNVITEAKDNDVKIDIAGNKDLKEGENTITVLVYNEKTKENSTYQIIVNKNANTEIKEANVEPAIQKGQKIRIILIGITALVVIGIVAFLIIKHKKTMEDEEDDKYEYDMEDKEKINLDNDEELFSRVNREKLTKIQREPKQVDIKEVEKPIEEKKLDFFENKQDKLFEKKYKEENQEEFFRTSNFQNGKH